MKKEMFGTCAAATHACSNALRHRLAADGVRMLLNSPVSRVEAKGGAVQVAFQSGGTEDFDHVVITAAAPVAARLCSGLSDEEARRLAGVRYLGIVCASVLLRKPLSGYYVTNLLDPGLPFTGVIEMSALVQLRALRRPWAGLPAALSRARRCVFRDPGC